MMKGIENLCIILMKLRKVPENVTCFVYKSTPFHSYKGSQDRNNYA